MLLTISFTQCLRIPRLAISGLFHVTSYWMKALTHIGVNHTKQLEGYRPMPVLTIGWEFIMTTSTAKYAWCGLCRYQTYMTLRMKSIVQRHFVTLILLTRLEQQTPICI